MVEPKVLTKAGVRLREMDPEVDHEAWTNRWFETHVHNGITTYNCRVSKKCAIRSVAPERRRMHVLLHFARPVCGICLFTGGDPDIMRKHFSGKHEGFGNDKTSGLLHGIFGARFWVSRANMPKFGHFIRVLGFGTCPREAKEFDACAGTLLCADYLPPQE